MLSPAGPRWMFEIGSGVGARSRSYRESDRVSGSSVPSVVSLFCVLGRDISCFVTMVPGPWDGEAGYFLYVGAPIPVGSSRLTAGVAGC